MRHCCCNLLGIETLMLHLRSIKILPVELGDVDERVPRSSLSIKHPIERSLCGMSSVWLRVDFFELTGEFIPVDHAAVDSRSRSSVRLDHQDSLLLSP